MRARCFQAWLISLCSFLLPGSLSWAEDGGATTDLDIEETLEEARAFGLVETDAAGNEWLIAPIPSYSPTFGWTLAVPVARVYRPESANPEDPAWMTGVGGFYSENESWGGGLFHRMNLGHDKWRLMSALAYADINYNYYGFGNIGGDRDRYIELSQTFGGGVLEALREISPNLYFGMRLVGTRTEVTDIGFPTLNLDLPGPEKGLVMDIVSLIPRLLYDTRDNDFYPHSGTLASLQVTLSSDSWGSDFEYSLYKLEWNHYLSLGDNQVLAMRVAGKYAAGRAPFFVLPAMGQGSDLRGYLAGVYRDNALVAGQAEYRLRLTKRFGIVAFAGIGGVGPGLDDLEEALPSYGGGLRWVLAKENDISLRVDIGWGKNDHEIYVGVGEAF
ncbi:MAG: BamA/TamA family outer membrane protein [Puniceicoccaceae bacterium]